MGNQMPEFKVFVETDQMHYFRIRSENPETVSKLALKEFLISGSLEDVVEILVLDPEDELGFGMPISQVRGSELSSLLGV
jgi:hypothetical protein